MGIRSFAAELLLPAALHRGRTPAPGRSVTPRPDVKTYAGLKERIGYLSKADQESVLKAYKAADVAHLGQTRDSGEPYVTHSLAVAGIVAEWRLDAQALQAALLHDTLEDCGVTKAELVTQFGSTTAELVDGLTKLDKLQFESREQGQAESFRKMVLAMTRDVRVIMIKLADRVHNMRTMGPTMAPHRKRRIALETLEIYAPIAHRLGLNGVYRELQARSFEQLHPWRHAVLQRALDRARGNRRDIIGRVQKEVEQAFARQKLKVSVVGREKTVFSTYAKMRSKRLGFAAVNDLFGFRILAPQLLDCYHALGILHQLYKPKPGRFKDYVAIPKGNGYQSLHTTLMSPLGTPVEFQIRTPEMDAVAETGIAAHWLYKQKNQDDGEAQRLGALWLQSLVDIQDDTQDAAEFLEHVKIDLQPESVYVLTPRGKILSLPRGSTVIDFAYLIHSDIGDRTVAARIDGEPVPLRTELKNGNTVEVETRPDARPSAAWLSFVRSARARSKIRQQLRDTDGHEARALGEKLLAQAVRAEGLRMPHAPAAGEPLPDGDGLWATLVRWSETRNVDELLIDVAQGRKIAAVVGKKIASWLIERGQRPDAVQLTLGRFGTPAAEEAQPAPLLVLDGSEGGSVTFGDCCLPIPGDHVRGYLGRGEGLVVHTQDCQVGRRAAERDPERWIPVSWSDQPTRHFTSRVKVVVHNQKGALAMIAQAVSQAEGDIIHIAMDQNAATDLVELTLQLSVRDRQHLADVLRQLRRAPPVVRAMRQRARGDMPPALRPAAPRREETAPA